MDDARTPTQSDDDLVLPFRTVRSDVIGRVIRLGSVVDTVLSRHAYPEPVSHVLGEALALTAMLGSALKTEAQAKLILQTKTDGPLDFLVTDFVAPASCAAMPISTRPTPDSPKPRAAATRARCSARATSP